MLARKPSPAASQYFRTWSQKFSTQISGDCTPALGTIFGDLFPEMDTIICLKLAGLWMAC
jgi:hypothetical protein